MRLEDISPGDNLTVLDCIYNPRDRSYRGTVFTVLHVDFPFAVCRSDDWSQGVTFDLREWHFKRVSDEYVAARKAAKLPPPAMTDEHTEATA
jgi:hypothetical protein